MKVSLKIMRGLLEHVRQDLKRPHSFAYERVGFLIASAAGTPRGILLTICDYQPVDDEDYERNESVGAEIGSDAMRKAVQAAYRPQRTLLHVHTHGGLGRPEFSSVDLISAEEFVPGFFYPVPKMPHGLLVLSDDDASGLYWQQPEQKPETISDFIIVGGPYTRNWRT